MTPFKLTEELLTSIEGYIDQQDNTALRTMMEDYHYADIAEVINELKEDQATYLIKLLNSEQTSDVLTELDEDLREAILGNLSSQEIAGELEELDTCLLYTSDAADDPTLV